MDEVQDFCVRMLGPGDAAAEAADTARRSGGGDRLSLMRAAVAACRQASADGQPDTDGHADVHSQTDPYGQTTGPHGQTDPQSQTTGPHSQTTDPHSQTTEPRAASQADPGLVEAVAGELARATARLPQRQREALALRERLVLSYAEIGAVIGIEPTAVAPLLARARLRLRSELRGTKPPTGACDERERALRTVVLRWDGEAVTAADEDWLIEHLGHCLVCAQSHSAMLEASACYRAWRLPDPEPAAAGGSAASG